MSIEITNSYDVSKYPTLSSVLTRVSTCNPSRPTQLRIANVGPEYFMTADEKANARGPCGWCGFDSDKGEVVDNTPEEALCYKFQVKSSIKDSERLATIFPHHPAEISKILISRKPIYLGKELTESEADDLAYFDGIDCDYVNEYDPDHVHLCWSVMDQYIEEHIDALLLVLKTM